MQSAGDKIMDLLIYYFEKSLSKCFDSAQHDIANTKETGIPQKICLIWKIKKLLLKNSYIIKGKVKNFKL